MIWIYCIFLILLTLIGRFWLYQRNIKRILSFVPGPPELPFLGNLMSVLGDREHMWKLLRKYNDEYYPMYRIILPNIVVVSIRDPDDVEALMTNIKQIKKSVIYNLLHPWLAEGLLTSFGRKWQKRRKMLTPGFHFNVLQRYMTAILETAENLVKDMKNEDGDRAKHLQSWVSKHTLNIICETAMGVSLKNMNLEEADKYKAAVDFMGHIVMHRMIRPWIFSDMLFSLTPLGIKNTRNLRTLHNFSTKIINERKKFHEQTGGKYLSEFNSNETDDMKIKDTKKLSMLDLLIAAYRKNEIDDSGIREEVDTFIFEGYDTTALAMSYTILCLAEYTDIQARARKEVNEVWENSGGSIGMGDIQKLTYLEMCIKETLRLFPSVPLIARELQEDLKLKNGVLPEGITVNVHIYDIHRDPNYWTDPLVYNPDRFLPENSKNRHPYCYIPFSGAFRNCIGQKFAMLELKTVIGFLLRNFIFEAIDKTRDARHEADLVLRSKNPLYVKFIPINL